MTIPEYDLVVIGSGPAGQKAAIGAAKRRKTVAVVDHSSMIGGVCVHKGTIPSKTVREAILHNGGCLEFTVSYVVEYRNGTAMKDQLFTKIVEEVTRSDGKLAWASSSSSAQANAAATDFRPSGSPAPGKPGQH